MKHLRLALAQVNLRVGDLDRNVEKIIAWTARARDAGCDIVAFPELATLGYPPEDLLFRPHVIDANLAARDEIVTATSGIVSLFGFVDATDDLYNAAAIAADGQLIGTYHKQLLPNYGVFDENRYFQAGSGGCVYRIDETVIGVNICEDIWHPGGPADEQALAGNAEVIFNLSASPYFAGKIASRDQMIATRATDNLAVVALVNIVGGQDELVFDGGSIIVDPTGRTIASGRQFEEDLVVADIPLDGIFRQRLRDTRRRKAKQEKPEAISEIPIEIASPSNLSNVTAPLGPRLERLSEMYQALCLGVRDYVEKNGFKQSVVALSGGIDSTLTAAIAADALGPENVLGVTMPSRYSSDGARSDAELLAENFGLEFHTIPIEPPFVTLLDILEKPFAGTEPNEAEENIQARLRGLIIMALSNKFGWLVLTTGNKSEMSVGYATLYGDMAGGFAVLKDVYKTAVFELAKWRNQQPGGVVIPQSTIDRPPSAELRPDQRDDDSLPPYDVLDAILEAYVEEDASLGEIAAMGFDEVVIRDVIRMVDRAEYKRRQAPPGIKITPRAFGKDRRVPISNRTPIG